MICSGIYEIRIGDWRYFGQSCDLKIRRRGHLADLRGGSHDNPIMQNAFNKYGEQSFSFRVLLRCVVEELDQYEQMFLDRFVGTEHCMNISKCAESPRRGIKFTAEERAQMSIRAKAIWERPGYRENQQLKQRGRKCPPRPQEWKDKNAAATRGKKRTEEHKQRQAELTKNRADENRRLFGKGHRPDTIAKMSANLMGNTRGVGRVVPDERKRQYSEDFKAKTDEEKRAIVERMREGNARKVAELRQLYGKGADPAVRARASATRKANNAKDPSRVARCGKLEEPIWPRN